VSAVGRLLAGREAEETLVGGADVVLDREFLQAAIKACPRQAADLLAHLVWRGPRLGEEGSPAPAFGNVPAPATATKAGEGGGGGEVVVPGGVVGAASAATAAADAGVVDLRSGMNVLSRVLHLNDDGVRGRLEVALRRLEAAVRASEAEGSSAAAGCDGTVYLAGKLVASLFVHLPEARPVLAHMPFFAASPASPAAGSPSGGRAR